MNSPNFQKWPVPICLVSGCRFLWKIWVFISFKINCMSLLARMLILFTIYLYLYLWSRPGMIFGYFVRYGGHFEFWREFSLFIFADNYSFKTYHSENMGFIGIIMLLKCILDKIWAKCESMLAHQKVTTFKHDILSYREV